MDTQAKPPAGAGWKAVLWAGLLLAVLETRRRTPALGSDTPQTVLRDDHRLISFTRGSDAKQIVAVHNTSEDSVMSPYTGLDLLTGRHLESPTPLRPYECRWLQPS